MLRFLPAVLFVQQAIECVSQDQGRPNLTTTGCTYATQCAPWPLHHELQLGGSAAMVKLTQAASGSAPVVNWGCN